MRKITLYELNEFVQACFDKWSTNDVWADYVFDMPRQIENYFGDGLYGIYDKSNESLEVDLELVKIVGLGTSKIPVMDILEEFNKWKRMRGKRTFIVEITESEFKRFKWAMDISNFEYREC